MRAWTYTQFKGVMQQAIKEKQRLDIGLTLLFLPYWFWPYLVTYTYVITLLVKVKLMLLQMKLLLWMLFSQEHKAVVLLLIAVVLSEAFTSECPGVYTMNKAKSGCNGIWSNGWKIELLSCMMFAGCLRHIGCTMDTCMMLHKSSSMSCMLQICIHQALRAPHVYDVAEIKLYELHASDLHSSSPKGSTCPACTNEANSCFKPWRLLFNLMLVAGNVCVHCLF